MKVRKVTMEVLKETLEKTLVVWTRMMVAQRK